MKCIRCGFEITDKAESCPNCGFQPDLESFSAEPFPPEKMGIAPESENKKEKNLVADLKSKIKESFYIKKDYAETQNYIDLYLSTIGIDAEVMEYQEKIQKLREKDNPPAEKSGKKIPSGPPRIDREIVEFEFDSSQPEDKISGTADRGEIILEEPNPIRSQDMIFEIENGELSEDELEKELEIELDSKEVGQLLDQEGLKENGEDISNEDVFVLEPEEEILELDDEYIEPQKPAEDAEKSKGPMSSFEIEINQERKETNFAGSDNFFSTSEFESVGSNFPSGGTEESAIDENLKKNPDTVESLLDDLQQKKKKLLHWVKIAIAVIIFITLIIALYILTKKNQTGNQPAFSAQKIQSIRQKTSPLKKKGIGSISTVEDEYQKYLKEAKNYFLNDDLKNAEIAIGNAKKIKITDELSGLEQDIKDKKKEKDLIQEIEEKEESKPADPEATYKKIINSSDIAALEAYLKESPSGERSSEIIKKITELKKKERESLEQQLKQNLQLFRKIHLRSIPDSLSPEEIQVILEKPKDISRKAETRIINGDKVFIDYSIGLMWHFWKETMEFRKAKWWANREYAGYFNWRLPTAEEVATLSPADISSFAEKISSPGNIWTSDILSKDSRYAWVFLPQQKVFQSIPENQYNQVCSVRSF